ncbi:MAG: hypothetical protein ABWX94_03090 [Candidatus Saccharimonadales bacterium]
MTYTFHPDVLNDVLAELNVNEPADLPESLLRDLCRRASHAETVRLMEFLEDKRPGETALVVDEDGEVELRSSEIGFDTMMRFAPEADEMDLLCDPQYNTVEVDIRVFGEQPEGADPALNIGYSVLRTTLRPPSLA